MSDLQIALAAIGAVVVAAVYAFNAWQERKFRRSMAEAFEAEHEDVLLQAPASAVTAAQQRIEPHLGGAAASPADPAAAAPDAADPEIEFAAAFTLPAPAGEAALRTLLSQVAMFGKPARVLGWDGAAWQAVGRDGRGSYTRLVAALQLANRAGPLHAAQLNGFCDAMRSWAAAQEATVTVPDAADGAAAAQRLDALCGEVDVAIGINVVPQSGGAFAGEPVAAAAAAAGFILEADGLFHWPDDDGNTLFTLENQAPEPFARERLATLQTPGLTLLLDVPRVRDAEAVLDRMVQAGGELAEALGGFIVDDNRVPLQAEGIARIKAQLRELHDTMATHGIPAGSTRAQRLFA